MNDISLSQNLIPCEICSIEIPFNSYEEHIYQCILCGLNIRTYEETIDLGVSTERESLNDMSLIQAIVGRDLSLLLENFQQENVPYDYIVQMIPLLFSRSNNYDFELTLQSVNEETDILVGLRSDHADVYDIFENVISINMKINEDISSVEISFTIMDIYCSICFEDYQCKSEYDIIKTKCNHFYCKTCIDEWFKRSSKCPVCNNEFDK
jgi:hypothetical protein